MLPPATPPGVPRALDEPLRLGEDERLEERLDDAVPESSGVTLLALERPLAAEANDEDEVVTLTVPVVPPAVPVAEPPQAASATAHAESMEE